MFVGRLPVKMQERGSQQTGCLLFTVVQIDSVRLAFEACNPGGLFFAAPASLLILPLSLHLRCPMPTNTPGISGFLSEQWCLPSTNHMALQLWAHWCKPMNDTCFSQEWFYMPVITPTLFGLCHKANLNT